MDIGICVASHIGDIDYVVRAEELGYSHAWLADSQMLWSDCYATLALAATRTSRIHLGTGVAVTATRPAPVNAAGIATINALAPGRTFLGVGAGNTATRVMGQKAPPDSRVRRIPRHAAAAAARRGGDERRRPADRAHHAGQGFRQLRGPDPALRLRVRAPLARARRQARRRSRARGSLRRGARTFVAHDRGGRSRGRARVLAG